MIKKTASYLATIAFGLLCFGAVAKASTLPSSCTSNGGGGFTCAFYESDTGASNVVTLPNSVGAGYVVVVQSLAIADTVISNWSDVLAFYETSLGSGVAATAQLLSSPLTFPTATTVLGSPNIFIAQAGEVDGVVDTVYFANPNTYNIYGTPVSAPEPGTLSLMAAGLIGLVALRKKIPGIASAA